VSLGVKQSGGHIGARVYRSCRRTAVRLHILKNLVNDHWEITAAVVIVKSNRQLF